MDKIEEIYERYDDIVKIFTKEKIQKRYYDVYQSYIDFIENFGLMNKVIVDGRSLMYAIMDYFTDISRLKEFHKISLTNDYKTIAYQVTWLLRRHPLQIISSADKENDNSYVNEKFVLAFIIDFLTRNLEKDFYDNFDSAQQKAYDGYIKTLFYYLKYRYCEAQVIELVLLSFEAGTLFHNIK